MIGDLRTAALVATDGSIDWFCAGRFDSPSVFARILDTDRGGSWDLAPVDSGVRTHQTYLPDSNILNTRFLADQGMVEVHDFMPVVKGHDADHRQRIVRRVQCVRGDLHVRMRLAARPDYGRERPTLTRGRGRGADRERLRAARVQHHVRVRIEGDDVVAELHLNGGDRALFVLEVLDADDDFVPCRPTRRRRALRRDERVLAGLDRPVDLPRPVARAGRALGPHAQDALPRAQRRHRRLGHHQPARADRRLAQLGLPLRLGARRRLQPVRAPAARLPRGGRGVHPLALRAAGGPGRRRGRRRARPAAGALRPRRQRARAPRSSSTTWPATPVRGRSASGTPRPGSSSSTSTAT